MPAGPKRGTLAPDTPPAVVIHDGGTAKVPHDGTRLARIPASLPGVGAGQ